MSSRDRRAAGRRRAWGRGPVILKFEPLEGRQLLSADLAGSVAANPPAPAETLPADAEKIVAIAAEEVTTTSEEPSHSPTTDGTDQPSLTIFSDEDQLELTVVSDDDDQAELLAARENQAEAVPVSAPTTSSATPNTGQPDLVAVRFMAQSNLDWDQEFTAQIGVMNQGKGTTDKPFTIDVYASPTMSLTQGAVKVGSVDVPAGLKPGEAFQFERRLSTPQVPIVDMAKSPSYYLLLHVDSKNEIAESNESNNVNRGLQGVDVSMVTVTPRQPSDLQAAGLAVSPGQLQWGGKLRVDAAVQNKGAGQAPPTNAWVVLSPANDTTPFSTSSYTIGTVAIPAINGNQSVQVSQEIRLPVEPPKALASLQNFKVTLIVDADKVADPVIRPFQWKGQGTDMAFVMINPKAATKSTSELPDLSISAIESPSAVVWGQTFTVKANVENGGASDAGPFKVRFLLMQGNGSSGPMLALGDARIPNLKAGHGRQVEQTVKLPARVPEGLSQSASQARIVAVVNPDHAFDESRVDNNSLSSDPIGLRVVGSSGDATPVVTTPTPAPAPTPTPSPPQPQGRPQPPPAQGNPQTPAPGDQNPGQAQRPGPGQGQSQLNARQQRLLALLEARRARIQAMMQQRQAAQQQRLRIFQGHSDQQANPQPHFPRIFSLRAAQQGDGPDTTKPA